MEGHLPEAINLPHRETGPASTPSLAKDRLVVTYCDRIFCNASTKAAARFGAQGFRVKEMLHGLAGWREEGYPVKTGLGPVELEH